MMRKNLFRCTNERNRPTAISKSPMRFPTNSCDGLQTYPMKIWLSSTNTVLPWTWPVNWPSSFPALSVVAPFVESRGSPRIVEASTVLQCKSFPVRHVRGARNIFHSQQHDVPLPSPLQPTGHITAGTSTHQRHQQHHPNHGHLNQDPSCAQWPTSTVPSFPSVVGAMSNDPKTPANAQCAVESGGLAAFPRERCPCLPGSCPFRSSQTKWL